MLMIQAVKGALMRMNRLFLVAFVPIVLLLGCSRKEEAGGTSEHGNRNEESATDGYNEVRADGGNATPRFDYFPLAVGNSWTYKCTIQPGREPLFSLVAQVEKPHPARGHTQGDWIWNYGRCANAKSGTETYAVSGYDRKLDAFHITVSEGAIETRKYSLQDMEDVYWRYNSYGVWEVIRARDLGETILVNGFLAFLRPGEGLEETLETRRKVSCEVLQDPVRVPAGKFTNCLKNVTTQLGGTTKEEIRTISYFAENVGLVKETQYDAHGEETYTLELIEFSAK